MHVGAIMHLTDSKIVRGYVILIDYRGVIRKLHTNFLNNINNIIEAML